jgi:hypothetical protein
MDEFAKLFRPIRIQQCREERARATGRGVPARRRDPRLTRGQLLASFCMYIDLCMIGIAANSNRNIMNDSWAGSLAGMSIGVAERRDMVEFIVED